MKIQFQREDTFGSFDKAKYSKFNCLARLSPAALAYINSRFKEACLFSFQPTFSMVGN